MFLWQTRLWHVQPSTQKPASEVHAYLQISCNEPMYSHTWKYVPQFELGQDKPQDHSKPRDSWKHSDNNDAWTQDTERFSP